MIMKILSIFKKKRLSYKMQKINIDTSISCCYHYTTISFGIVDLSI